MLTGGEYQLPFSFDLNLETFMCIRPEGGRGTAIYGPYRETDLGVEQ